MEKKSDNTSLRGLVVAVLALAVLVVGAVFILPHIDKKPAESGSAAEPVDNSAEVTEPTEKPNKHIIENVNVLPQQDLKAGCETYACTMLLQTLGFDIDEFRFAEDYLDVHWVYYGDDGLRYGPDMYSAQAGDVYTGWGIYAPAMAKCMNRYLKDTGSSMTATAYEGVPLTTLCDKYINNDIPVMVWATTWMMEPYEKDSWIVNYVDENAKYEIGDTFTWLQNEHCLVLIGYDEENYYFADSCAGEVSVFERGLVEERYEQLYSQCIVVE